MGKYAYADPPYIGQAKKHYSHDSKCAEVDHKILVERLCFEYDGWALSCSSPSLKEILSYCPSGTRVAAWLKPFCIFKPNVNPAYCWEPVIFYGCKKRDRYENKVRDYLIENISLKKGVPGAKPIEFCIWVFDLLNIGIDDTLDDLYPGTGIVSKTWERWKRRHMQMPLDLK